MELHQWCIPGL